MNVMPRKVPPASKQNRATKLRPNPRTLPAYAEDSQDLNFKVKSDFHYSFKITATKRKMPMKDLLDASFRCWVKHHGDAEEKALLPPER
jgi:hypothetical protein